MPRHRDRKVLVQRQHPNPQSDCLLFSLPPELRTTIYDHVFTVQPSHLNEVVISWNPTCSTPTVLGILQTCRLINDEAASMFYIVNDICLSAEGLLATRVRNEGLGLLRSLDDRRLGAIVALTVAVLSMEEVTMACRAVRRLTGLKRLVFGFAVAVGVGEWEREREMLKRAVRRLEGVERIEVRVVEQEHLEEIEDLVWEVVDCLPSGKRA